MSSFNVVLTSFLLLNRNFGIICLLDLGGKFESYVVSTLCLLRLYLLYPMPQLFYLQYIFTMADLKNNKSNLNQPFLRISKCIFHDMLKLYFSDFLVCTQFFLSCTTLQIKARYNFHKVLGCVLNEIILCICIKKNECLTHKKLFISLLVIFQEIF